MPVTLDTSYFDRSPLNDVTVMNMQDMMITLETSHFDRSPLSDVTRSNMEDNVSDA